MHVRPAKSSVTVALSELNAIRLEYTELKCFFQLKQLREFVLPVGNLDLFVAKSGSLKKRDDATTCSPIPDTNVYNSFIFVNEN